MLLDWNSSGNPPRHVETLVAVYVHVLFQLALLWSGPSWPVRSTQTITVWYFYLMLQLDVCSVLRCDFVVLTVRLGLGKDHVRWFCRHKRSCTLFQRLSVNIRRFHGYKRWNCLSACVHRRVVGRNVDLCIRTFPLSSDMNHLVTPLIYLMTLQRGLTRRLGTIGHNKVIHNKICTLVGYVIIKLLHLEQLQQ